MRMNEDLVRLAETSALGEYLSDYDDGVPFRELVELVRAGGKSEKYTVCEQYEWNTGEDVADHIETHKEYALDTLREAFLLGYNEGRKSK